MKNQDNAPRYEWRLAALMGERKIRTGAELQRLLAERGYDITSSQLSRIIYDRPLQIKTALLDALGEVFDCTLNDLMPLATTSERKPTLGSGPVRRKKRVRAPTAPDATMTDEDFAGPVVRAFPIPKK